MDMNERQLHSLANFDRQDFVENTLLLMNYVEALTALKVDL
jgi:hypothetical protein